LFGASSKQNSLFSFSLYMIFAWTMPNSSLGAFWASLSASQ
jgi:hypothetical protein